MSNALGLPLSSSAFFSACEILTKQLSKILLEKNAENQKKKKIKRIFLSH